MIKNIPKKLQLLETGEYYFDIVFWGDSTTPMYKVKMYEKAEKRFLWFKWSKYVLLIAEDYHESLFTAFKDICIKTYWMYDKRNAMADKFSNDSR